MGGPYAYRCPRCQTTSDPLETRAEADAEGWEHRHQFHGGHHPDGEEIIPVPPEPVRWTDIPRREKIATVVVALLILAGILFKAT